jgi:hypothetical protein
MKVSSAAPTPSHTSDRHRGDGNRPSGESRKIIPTRPIGTIHSQLATHAATRAVMAFIAAFA